MNVEPLPKCPFVCKGCDRKVEVLTHQYCINGKKSFYVGKNLYNDTCFLHNCDREQYDTKEKAIAAWKKAVGKDE